MPHPIPGTLANSESTLSRAASTAAAVRVAGAFDGPFIQVNVRTRMGQQSIVIVSPIRQDSSSPRFFVRYRFQYLVSNFLDVSVLPYASLGYATICIPSVPVVLIL